MAKILMQKNFVRNKMKGSILRIYAKKILRKCERFLKIMSKLLGQAEKKQKKQNNLSHLNYFL